MIIALGSDHGGYKLKEEIKKYLDEKNIQYKDFGTDSEERTDYPIFAEKVARSIQNRECEKGILLCRAGHGMTIAANKFRGVRAATVYTEESARFAKSDDDVNVITIGGDYINTSKAIQIIRTWLATEFRCGRYEDRLKMIEKIEDENMK